MSVKWIEDESVFDSIREKISGFKKERGSLIPALQMIQSVCSYLPEKAIYIVSEYLKVSSSDIYGVATFYNQFRFHPPGKYPVKVCLGTACHVKGSDIILENFERKLGIKEGETTADREFSIERAACVGCCALAPVAIVADKIEGHMAPSKVEGIFIRIQVQKDIEKRERQKNESV